MLIKTQEIIQGGDAGGVYIPRKIGNKDPNLHYGVVIDCGSSGSRLYIYVWPEHSGRENELLQIKQLLDRQGNPVVKKLEPGMLFAISISIIFIIEFEFLGLSSMAKTPQNATEYLKMLLGKQFFIDVSR